MRATVVLLAAGLIVIGPIVAAPSSAAAVPECATTIVLETDGYHAGTSLANWRASAFNLHPPQGVHIVPVPYQDGVFPLVDARPLDDAVAGGVAALSATVAAVHANCPAAHLVLAGYSEGAVVAGDTLARLARSGGISHRQLSGVLYGDPRRAFGYSGRDGVAGGIETNLPTVLPGVTMTGPRDFGDIPVREVCQENDGICNSANLLTNLLGFVNGLVGYALGDHVYDLNPTRDAARGPGTTTTLIRQTPRIPYGAAVAVPIGTPWQIQQAFGDAAVKPLMSGSCRTVAALLRSTAAADRFPAGLCPSM